MASLATYMFFDEVCPETTRTLCEFIIKANVIFPKTQPLTIMINSPGGDAYSGFGLIDLMEVSRLKIATVGVGCVASMGVSIFTAGTHGMRTMSRNSFMMTHQFSSYAEGKYHEFVAQRDHEDELHDRFIEHFLRHSSMTKKQIKEVLLGPSDHWISAKEALKFGLCDKIKNPWS
jgi:ATP-dependent Clp protease protease subunit